MFAHPSHLDLARRVGSVPSEHRLIMNGVTILILFRHVVLDRCRLGTVAPSSRSRLSRQATSQPRCRLLATQSVGRLSAMILSRVASILNGFRGCQVLEGWFLLISSRIGRRSVFKAGTRSLIMTSSFTRLGGSGDSQQLFQSLVDELSFHSGVNFLFGFAPEEPNPNIAPATLLRLSSLTSVHY